MMSMEFFKKTHSVDFGLCDSLVQGQQRGDEGTIVNPVISPVRFVPSGALSLAEKLQSP